MRPPCDNTPPHDESAERALLGSYVLRPDLLNDPASAVDPSDLYLLAHREVLAAIREMHAAGTPIDAVTLAVRLGNDGDAATRAVELLESVPHSLHAPHYATIVREHARRRRIIEAAREAERLARDPDADLTIDWPDAERRLIAAGESISGRGMARLTCLADVEARPVSWLWPGRIPLGRLTLLVGQPGVGKSFLTADATARVSTGSPWPDGSPCPRGSVLLLSAEDDPGDTIRPRLDAHHADVSRVHLLTAVGSKGGDRCATLADVEAIEDCLRRIPDVRLLVVDPIGSYLGGRTDAHRDNEVRSVLAPIAALAERYGVAVVLVAHRRKGTAALADDLALGSKAFTGIARAVWHLQRDPDDHQRRLLLPGKNNLGPESGGLAWMIVPDPARIAWEADPVHETADDCLRREQAAQRPGPDADARTAAEDWLRSALADGPRQATDLKDEWKNGEGGSLRTLDRAKTSIGVAAFRPENPGPWFWRLDHNAKQNATSSPRPTTWRSGRCAENAGLLPDSEGADCHNAKFPVLGNLETGGPSGWHFDAIEEAA